MNEQTPLGAAILLASLIGLTLTTRCAFAPAGRHRTGRPAPALPPVVAFLPCPSLGCSDLITEHVEIGDALFRCTACKRMTGGAL